ncbi:hypothetical protein [Nocardia acididurans]|nr:hypothetical protein [Nocardia acididurans]
MQALHAITAAGTVMSALGYLTYVGMAWDATESTDEGEQQI